MSQRLDRPPVVTMGPTSLRRCIGIALLALYPALVVADDKPLSAADYYVHDLPGLSDDVPNVKMHAGHIEVTPETNGNLFFWHFQNKHIADRQRTVIWLNGGPGCSSEDGALMEIGPYRVIKDSQLVANEGSWNEFANLLFVDNPVGTGYSYVDTDSYIHELDTMAEQFLIFLEKFFGMFPEYENDDIYIAGESYAGQHIPYIAKAMLARNKDKARTTWNLKGLLIGNGWISPEEQYEAYVDFAVERNLIKDGSEDHKNLKTKLDQCKARMSSDPGHVDYGVCEGVLSQILSLTKTGGGNDACINMYDIRLRDSYPSCGMNWPPDLQYVKPYLRQLKVASALHVNPSRNTGWQECNGAVGSAFNVKKSQPSIKLLPDIIREVPTLLFSGAEDLICNHIGTEKLIENMSWNGGKGFNTKDSAAPQRNWTVEGESAGYWQEARNLTYVLFKDSSHMVPFDYPRRSRDMLDRFMGVDFNMLGHTRIDSLLEGEEPQKSGSATKPHDDEQKNKEVEEAKWAAYRRSGEIVLVITVVAAAVWGYFIWRERRKRTLYSAVNSNDSTGAGFGGFSRKRGPERAGDLEAAAFDESELDDLHVQTPTAPDGSKYALGEDSDDESVDEKRQQRGAPSKASGSGSS